MKKLGSFKYVILILLSAFVYSFNIPFLNMFGSNIPPFLKNTCLYFGAAISMLLIIIYQKFKGGTSSGFNKKNLPYVILIGICEVGAATTFILGVSKVSSETSSLLLAFQTLATSFIALGMFKEKVGILGWVGIFCILCSAICLSVNENGFVFNEGAIYILAACIFWSLSNNLARKAEGASSYYLVLLKAVVAASFCLFISRFINEPVDLSLFNNGMILCVLGFCCYGIAVAMVFIIENVLGVSITICYFGINPFFGSVLSILLFHIKPYFTFYISMGLVLSGIVVITINQYLLEKKKNAQISNNSSTSN